jgi:hypothetical protein
MLEPEGRQMTTATFQKGDRVEFKEFPEVTEGKIVELWRRGFYKVAWESGLTYQGKTTIVSGNVIRKKPS